MSGPVGITGLRIRLERTIDVPCAVCGETVVTIGPSAGPHAAALHCSCCDRHRGWLPKPVANFLADAATLFGRSTEPILICNSQFKLAAPSAGAVAASISTAP
jgi:hypothetical protein